MAFAYEKSDFGSLLNTVFSASVGRPLHVVVTPSSSSLGLQPRPNMFRLKSDTGLKL